ncbi:unnamed protein product [Leptosia nina]|uniref:Uncharacterized protein n=1 Tax=Leptosia nina TaxID=320188 RepID=A0AAV1J2P1_9NEOP
MASFSVGVFISDAFTCSTRPNQRIMDSLHPFVLIFLHHVVSHSCRGISSLPQRDVIAEVDATSPDPTIPDFLADDDEHKYDDIRNLLRIVPYQDLKKWKTNYLRGLPLVRKHNAAPIALILAPSNIVAKLQRQKKKQDIAHNIFDMLNLTNKHDEVEPHSLRDNTQANGDKSSDLDLNDISEEGPYDGSRVKVIQVHDNSSDEKVTPHNDQPEANTENHHLFIDVRSNEYKNVDKDYLHNHSHEKEEVPMPVHNVLRNSTNTSAEFKNNIKDNTAESHDSEDKKEKKIDDVAHERYLKKKNPVDKVQDKKAVFYSNNIYLNTNDTSFKNDFERKDKIVDSMEIDDSSSKQLMDNENSDFSDENKEVKKEHGKMHLDPIIECFNGHCKKVFHAGYHNGIYKFYNLSFLFHK